MIYFGTFGSAVCYTKYTIYLSLWTPADPRSSQHLNPFREFPCMQSSLVQCDLVFFLYYNFASFKYFYGNNSNKCFKNNFMLVNASERVDRLWASFSIFYFYVCIYAAKIYIYVN